MRRKLLLVLVLALCLPMGSVSGAESPISFQIDGETVSFDEGSGYPYLDPSGRVMMPVRICLNAIGCNVEWNPYDRNVGTWKGLTEVIIPVGEPQIIVNDKIVPVDTAAVIRNGRTYLPLRAVLEAYKYNVNWDQETKTVKAASAYTPGSINGGKTGVFLRKQLEFTGFDGIQAEVRLPRVILGQKGDCPYVYFGFDWADGKGDAEGGFQFIQDEQNPGYDKWTVYLRQGNEWRWGDNILLEQGSSHTLRFYADVVSETQTDLVIDLDGREVVRKVSAVNGFDKASVKYVNAIGMSVLFDGINCPTASIEGGIYNTAVSKYGEEDYVDFESCPAYSAWRNGYWYGTVECLPDYMHYSGQETVSLYRVGKSGNPILLSPDEVVSGAVANAMIGGEQRHQLSPEELQAFINLFNSCGIREGEREWTGKDHNHMSHSIDVGLTLKDGSTMYLSAYYDGDIMVSNEHGRDYYLHNAALLDYIHNTMGKYL